jgi:hypothetical protein
MMDATPGMSIEDEGDAPAAPRGLELSTTGACFATALLAAATSIRVINADTLLAPVMSTQDLTDTSIRLLCIDEPADQCVRSFAAFAGPRWQVARTLSSSPLIIELQRN